MIIRSAPYNVHAVHACLCLLLLLVSCFATAGERLLEFRLEADPYGDFSWGLPNALLKQSPRDTTLYLAKLRAYSSGELIVSKEGLSPASALRDTLHRVLLDKPENRARYYARYGQPFTARDNRLALRSLNKQYRRLSESNRRYLASALVDLYQALIEIDDAPYREALKAFEIEAQARQLVPPGLVIPAFETLRPQPENLDSESLARYLDTSITASSLECARVSGLPVSLPFPRVALDAGHFGGEAVTDSREYRGYREGRGAFIVAVLVKAYISECLGVASSQILLTRDNLYTLYGNGDVNLINNALMDYRTELLAYLEPELALSLHTDGGVQRISVFTPCERPVYYFYRGRQFWQPAERTLERSGVLAESLLSGLEDSLHPLSGSQTFGSIYQPVASEAPCGRSKIFQNLVTRGIPVALVEGISHASPGMAEFLVDPAQRTETVRVGAVSYPYNPLLRHYAEGVVRGLLGFITKPS
ncbi:MAG: hypothetical protein AAGI88_00090 [Pseudomonadota bacterium]